MRYDPEKHHRRSIRLGGYDYSQAGAYFVTICTENHQCLFGEIIDGRMRLNDTGSVIERWWCELNKKFPPVETDEFVVMPNHFHGIVVIAVGADLRVGPVPLGLWREEKERCGEVDTGICMGRGHASQTLGRERFTLWPLDPLHREFQRRAE